jgi:hypothetical protein
MNRRACGYCGGSLEGYRKQARFCSDAHRLETLRIYRLVKGLPDGRYLTLAIATELQPNAAGLGGLSRTG